MNNVQNNYKVLAATYPDRFVVIDTTNFDTNDYKYLAGDIYKFI